MTEYAGHACEISQREKDKGTDIVVAVGGDGTVNEVASELVNSDTALALIPCGSGDGLARHLQIPLNIKGAIETINLCNIESLDYATVCGRPFFVTCGMGFDAYVSYRFAEAKTRGVLTYLEQALTEWLRYKPETYTVEDANGTEKIQGVPHYLCQFLRIRKQRLHSSPGINERRNVGRYNSRAIQCHRSTATCLAAFQQDFATGKPCKNDKNQQTHRASRKRRRDTLRRRSDKGGKGFRVRTYSSRN